MPRDLAQYVFSRVQTVEFRKSNFAAPQRI